MPAGLSFRAKASLPTMAPARIAAGLPGRQASAVIDLFVRPVLLGAQFAPPSVLLKTPKLEAPA